MTDFKSKKEESERNTREAIEKVQGKKIPRLVQPQSGTITNNTYFSEGDIYTPDNVALRAEIKCLKKSLQEKERIIAVLKEEIELFKKILEK